ncbi:MAG TPA: CRTAC1 family protein, partial [Pricia sp.]|nr:CRTAC1 family protein [Pricia sp.]
MFNILPPNPFRTIAALVLISSSAFSQEPTRFTLLDNAATNVHFNNTIKDSNEANILIYANFYGGAGVGVGDFNNDGLQDLYFAGNIVPDKLYLNQGNMVFEDATERSGIKQDGGWSTGVTVADINNDGFLDIYVSRELHDKKPEWRTNLLYINNGNGTFSESAKAFGVDNSERTRHSTFLDYDNDGFLDLFLLTQPPNPGSYSEFFGTDLKSKEYHLKLLKNTGNGSFVDVSQSAGIDLTGFPNGVCASDINNDGYTDIYVANDFDAPDFLFQNNRDGTFTNIADAAIKHTSYYSMGVDIADINNDALLDIFVVDMVAEDNFRLKSNMSGMNPDSFWKVVDEGGGYQYMYNTVQLNNGNSTFSDIAQFTGMAATDWSWSNLIADFDNDGLKDTYVTNGLLYDIRNTDADKNVASLVNKTTYDYLQNNPDGGNLNSIWDILNIDEVIALLPSQPLKNYAFQNKGNLNFENKRSEWGLDQESFSNGAAYADFDNDGDLDIVVNNINQEAFIYRNNSERMENANYLRVRLVDEGNKPVLGSKVTLHTSKGIQYQETTNVRGIYSTSEQLVHFGLGNIDQVDSLTINWPNGKTTVQRNIEPNQTLAFDMNDASKD